MKKKLFNENKEERETKKKLEALCPMIILFEVHPKFLNNKGVKIVYAMFTDRYNRKQQGGLDTFIAFLKDRQEIVFLYLFGKDNQMQ